MKKILGKITAEIKSEFARLTAKEWTAEVVLYVLVGAYALSGPMYQVGEFIGENFVKVLIN